LTFRLDYTEKLKTVSIIMTCLPIDIMFVDNIALHEVDKIEMIPTEEERAYVPWRWVPKSSIAYLPETLRVVSSHRNLIQNPSFECHVDRLISKRHAKADTTTAVHGRASLLVRRSDPFDFKYDETIYASVVPGRLYTLSFFGKTNAVTGIIPVRILSSFCASRTRWDSDVRPGFSVSFSADTNWRRYSISFVPEKTLKNMLSVLFCQHPGSRGLREDPAIWIDAVQLEEGELTDFRLENPVQVSVTPVQPQQEIDCTDAAPKFLKDQYPPGIRFTTRRARDFTWVDDVAIPLRITVWQENPAAKVSATLHIIDYYGREVHTVKRTIQTGGKNFAEDTFAISGLCMGSFVVRGEVSAGDVTANPEQTLFAKIPGNLDNDPLLDPPVFSFLGDDFQRARNHHQFGFRFLRGLPGWLEFATAWSNVEPQKGQWQFQTSTLDWTQALGYNVFVNLNGLNRIPQWARVDKSKYPEESCENAFGFHHDDLIEYVTQVVRR